MLLRKTGLIIPMRMNHFIILGSDYAPTIVIKKSAYTVDEIKAIAKVAKSLPADFPRVTYLPFLNNPVNNEVENILLQDIKNGQQLSRRNNSQ